MSTLVQFDSWLKANAAHLQSSVSVYPCMGTLAETMQVKLCFEESQRFLSASSLLAEFQKAFR